MTNPPRPLWLLKSLNQTGTTFASRNLAAGMIRQGVTPVLFAQEGGDGLPEFEQLDIPVKIFPRMGGLFLGGAAHREAANRRVSVVHALSPDMMARGERIAAKLEIPLVVTVNRLEEGEISSMEHYSGQGVIAVSTAIRERMVNRAGLAQQRIRVIHNGIDLCRAPLPDFAAAAQEDLSKPWRTPVIGTLGHLSEKKGQRVFLQAAKILIERGLDAEFVVLGDGPDRSALRGLAEQLNVSKRVTFTPQTVSGQLNQLDILVEPSLQEGLGISAMQAMAAGVPVVATGVGGLYDLIEDGHTGVMVPAADAAALAEAIWRLLKNPSERVEMARQAREKIETAFGADLVAEEHINYYLECIDLYHAKRRNSVRISNSFRP